MNDIEGCQHSVEKEEKVGFPVQVGEVDAPGCPVDNFDGEEVNSEVEPVGIVATALTGLKHYIRIALNISTHLPKIIEKNHFSCLRKSRRS